VPDGFDDQDSIKYLNSLHESFFPVSVCFTFGDLSSDRVLQYSRAGFEIVSLGNPWNKDFVDSFYSMIGQRKLLISEGYGSQVPLAIEYGIPVKIIPRRSSEVDESTGKEVRNPSENYNLANAEQDLAESLFDKILITPSPEQTAWAQKLLGYEFKDDLGSIRRKLIKNQSRLFLRWFWYFLIVRNWKSLQVVSRID
jgi:hypothetical protein